MENSVSNRMNESDILVLISKVLIRGVFVMDSDFRLWNDYEVQGNDVYSLMTAHHIETRW